MEPWLTWIGWIAAGLLGTGVILFASAALAEREWRALGVSLALGGGAVALLAVPLLIDVPGRTGWLVGVLGVGVVVALAVGLPLGDRRPVRVVDDQPRVDERDAFFHRFHRLEPGLAEYDAYYADHPDQQTFDDRVREMPGLAAPGSRAYHPATAPFPGATFELIEEMTRALDREPAPLEDPPPALDPAELTSRLKGLARYHGAVEVGCTTLNPAYVYSHNARGPGPWGEPIALEHSHALVFAVEMDHRMVRQAPGAPTLTESARQYLESAKIAIVAANVLRRLGHEARAHVDGNYRVMVVPLAVDAGLGELGRLGLLMTPRYGPRVRLTAVTTTAPLVPDAPRPFGAADFCEICKKCADACPSASIPGGPRVLVAGAEKWQSRQDTCYRYWRQQGTDCALCLRVCPFSHPATLAHRPVRWAIRRSAAARRLALWGDDLCYGRRPVARYPVPPWHAT